MILSEFPRFVSNLLLRVMVCTVLMVSPAFGDDHDDGLDALDGRTAEQVSALQDNIDEVIETAAFYSAFWALLALLICGAFVQRKFAWAAYAGLTLCALMWNALFEQNLGGLYWLGFALSPAGVVTGGFALASLSSLVAVVLATGKLRRNLMLVAGAVIALWIAHGVLPDQSVPALLSAALVAAAIVHVFPLSKMRMVFSQLGQKRLLLGAAIVVVIWGGFVVAELNEEFDPIFLNRAIVGLLTSAFIVVFLMRTVAVLRDRDAAIQQSLADAQKEAATSQALFETEKRYNDARALAKERSRRLATASHDIRQPIAALRATMAAAMRKDRPEIRTQMNASFDYLEQLAGEYIDEGRIGEKGQLMRSERVASGDALSADLIGATIDRMFKTEAAAKDLAFSVAVTPALLGSDPLKLMRGMSNLTSNAINHTENGFVRINGDIVDGRYVMSVTNSAALPAAARDVSAAYVKGDTSDGSGLGLAIVQELSETDAFDFELDTSVPSQTTMRLIIPILES